MSHDNGDTQDLAHHLAAACNEYAQAHGKVFASSGATMETVNGHAFTVSYDGCDYTVIVTLSASQLAADEFWEYE